MLLRLTRASSPASWLLTELPSLTITEEYCLSSQSWGRLGRAEGMSSAACWSCPAGGPQVRVPVLGPTFPHSMPDHWSCSCKPRVSLLFWWTFTCFSCSTLVKSFFRCVITFVPCLVCPAVPVGHWWQPEICLSGSAYWEKCDHSSFCRFDVPSLMGWRVFHNVTCSNALKYC